MSLLRLFAQRIVLGVVAAWAVLTAVFALFTMTDDWVLGGIVGNLRFAGAEEEEIEMAVQQYLAQRGLDQPLYEQYLDWMGNMLTFRWGESFVTGEPAFELVTGALYRTLLYVVPGAVLAIAVGISIGLYVALNPESRIAETSRISAYLLFSIPSFWVGGYLFSYTMNDARMDYSPLLFEHVLPIAFVFAALLGGYVSYSRAHSLEYASAEFVTLVRSKGANRLLIARHVVRNAAIPFFSMLFTEALALLVLAVFVIEVLFGIEGFGLVLFEAINERDLPVILGGTLYIVAFGIVGNILQDISYTTLDPRVDTGSR